MLIIWGDDIGPRQANRYIYGGTEHARASGPAQNKMGGAKGYTARHQRGIYKNDQEYRVNVVVLI